jgi:Domain of unknown function (DUF1905)/Bacteriocin-protection, YdeI or OmpD-Associated
MTRSARVRFRGRIDLRGVNPFVRVRADQAARLRAGWRRPLPVRVQVNRAPDPPWRVSMMPAGDGDFYLYLNGIVRAASDTKVGDFVVVDVEYDATYTAGPVHPMPVRFAEGLRRSPRAQRNWKRLPPSLRKEMLRYFAHLRSVEARQRNVDRALRVLAGGRERFLGRSWDLREATSTDRAV